MLADNIILCDIVGESEGQIVCHDGSGDNHNYHTDDDAVNATAGPGLFIWKRKHQITLYGELPLRSGYGPVLIQTTEWMNKKSTPTSCFHPFECRISAITYLISRTTTYPIYKNEKLREAETITEVSA